MKIVVRHDHLPIGCSEKIFSHENMSIRVEEGHLFIYSGPLSLLKAVFPPGVWHYVTTVE